MKISNIFLFILLFINFSFFSFYDFNITVAQSYSFFYHDFFNFFDINKSYLPFDKAPYLPFLYFLFTLWNIPLYLFDLLSSVSNWQNLSAIEIYWNKFFIFIIFLISSKFIYKLCYEISLSQSKAKYSQLFFLSSPISLFIITILGCYDIFSILFTLIAIYYLFKNKIFYFLLFVSISISFKFFSFFIFLPIFLMIEKNYKRIFLFVLVGLSFSVFQIILYFHSDVFLGNISFWNINGLQPVEFSLYSLIKIIIGGFIYITILIYCYFYSSTLDKNFKLNLIVVCLLSYVSLFYAVRIFHIQWTILLIPFMSIIFCFIYCRKLFLLIDIIGFLSFLWISVNQSPGFIDFNLVKQGPISNLLPQYNLFLGSFIYNNSLYLFFGIMFALYIVSIFLLYVFKIKDFLSFNKFSIKQLFIYRYLTLFILFTFPSFFSLFMKF